MAQVLISDMTKRFGDVVAVDQLNLDIQDKEFIVLLGPSGCGKTTSLRCIAGLENPEEGEIRIGDRVVNNLEPKDRDVAMVFQNYALYPHMTVAQNMAFPLQNFNTPPAEINKRILETSELLEIKPLLHRKPTALSGGQMQRVALGRAIVRHPKVFLMDEPLSNLDAKLRVHMRAELKRLQKDLGVTTIYVTHDQIEAMTMGDRIAIMEDGVLQQFAPPDQVYDHPSNRFVAGFVGTPPMNFFEGSLTRDGVINAGGFQYTLSPDLVEAAGKSSSAEITMGIRPQDVRVHTSPGEDGFIGTELYTTEPLGEVVIVTLQVGENLVKASVSADFRATQEEYWMELPPERVYLFDGKDGKTLT
ncbi:MAG: ABC transporter ATP-binding protein [Thermoplasmata archaeon]